MLPKHPRYQAAPRPVTTTLVYDPATTTAATETQTRKGVCDWIWRNVLLGTDNLDPGLADARTLGVRTWGAAALALTSHLDWGCCLNVAEMSGFTANS